LTSKVASKSSIERSSASPSPPTPALLTRMSTVPSSAAAPVQRRPMAWASATSSAKAIARPPAGVQLGRQGLDLSTRRAVIATAAPLRLSIRAKCAPRPPLAPVMNATFPASTCPSLPLPRQ
jgi:hypothetical protein